MSAVVSNKLLDHLCDDNISQRYEAVCRAMYEWRRSVLDELQAIHADVAARCEGGELGFHPAETERMGVLMFELHKISFIVSTLNAPADRFHTYLAPSQ